MPQPLQSVHPSWDSTSALHSQAEALLSSPYPVCSVLLRLRLQALAAALARDANVLANLSGQDATCITKEEISFERESLVTAASAANTLVEIAARCLLGAGGVTVSSASEHDCCVSS